MASLKFPRRLVEQFGVSPMHRHGLYVPKQPSRQSPLRSQLHAIAVSFLTIGKNPSRVGQDRICHEAHPLRAEVVSQWALSYATS
jgi:hypothetical protein